MTRILVQTWWSFSEVADDRFIPSQGGIMVFCFINKKLAFYYFLQTQLVACLVLWLKKAPTTTNYLRLLRPHAFLDCSLNFLTGHNHHFPVKKIHWWTIWWGYTYYHLSGQARTMRRRAWIRSLPRRRPHTIRAHACHPTLTPPPAYLSHVKS